MCSEGEPFTERGWEGCRVCDRLVVVGRQSSGLLRVK